jgi:curli production assembly/transport component CsgE
MRASCVYPAEAEPQRPAAAAAEPSVHEGGLVTDQTITPAGHDFYQQFSALWYDKPLQDHFSIAVRERPSAREGNRVQIDYANRTVFEAVLPAARGNIAGTSSRAVDVVYERVSAAEVERLLFREPDLAADEF